MAPSFVVDITRDLRDQDARHRGLCQPVHSGSRRGRPGLPLDRFRENVELAARRNGQRIRVRYGEAFVTREPLEVQDLLALGGSSF